LKSCKNCYHLRTHVDKDGNKSYFCYAEGFNKNIKDETSVDCYYFREKNKEPELCPDCHSVRRRDSIFCLHCKVLKYHQKKKENASTKEDVDNNLPGYKLRKKIKDYLEH